MPRSTQGYGAATSLGTVAPGMSIALTGVEAIGGVGSVDCVGNNRKAMIGVATAVGMGTMVPTVTVALTGVGATAALGELDGSPNHKEVALTGVGAVTHLSNIYPLFKTAFRTYIVPYERRVLTCSALPKTETVAPEARTWAIPADHRVMNCGPDLRTIEEIPMQERTILLTPDVDQKVA